MRIERANAKINLYLNVISKRENGYHNIVSLMQTVSLCDLVSVEFRPSAHTQITLRASGNAAMPTDCRNLAWRAAEKYLEATGQSGEVLISIEKHIPMAAGLAGGSADAAAVLRALNRLCGSHLSVEALCELGGKLGADVPFCIVGGGALVEGIGERLTQIDSMPGSILVVACMGEGVSTPIAYAKLDDTYCNFTSPAPKDPRVERLLCAIKAGDLSGSYGDLFNLFEEVVPQMQGEVDKVKDCMVGHGALRAMMSGSGPSVFGVFPDSLSAQAACEAIKAMGGQAFVCHPCGKFSGV